VDRFSYDPWGKRRQAVTSPWLSILPGSHLIPASLANLTRGFTGHEHLDRVGLIHMNGRIYDPELGRFLSADPILQFPASTQGLDRYAYVLNNPVSLSDPSGHLVFGLAAALIGVKLAASGKFVLAALTAAIGGYLDTGSLKAGIFSAISAGFSFGVGAIGEALKASFSSAFQLAAVATLHGLTQGILAVAQGGKFGAGFLSAAASSVFGPKGSGAGISDGKRLVRILQAAAIGGTASRIGGGKFANGAVTGAFVQAFNDQLHGGEASDEVDSVLSEPTVSSSIDRSQSSETWYVPSLDDLGIPEVVVPLPPPWNRLDFGRDALNAAYYRIYDVEIATYTVTEVTTVREHLYFRNRTGLGRYIGSTDLVLSKRVVSQYQVVTGVRPAGYAGGFNVMMKSGRVVNPACVQVGSKVGQGC
jgi:RHS repeat-associated protein